MRTTLIRCEWFLAGAALLSAAPQQGAKSVLLVSTIFGDHMVLQRGKPNATWGWSTPGDKVRIELAERSATVAGADGRWQARIESPAAGGPHTLRIAGQQQAVAWTDVLVGDAWICAGQSDMQFGGEKPAEFAIAKDDQRWYWAYARVEDDPVVVSSPRAVRYAWQTNSAPTLLNGAGLPAVPFRTDHWPGITAGRTRHDF